MRIQVPPRSERHPCRTMEGNRGQTPCHRPHGLLVCLVYGGRRVLYGSATAASVGSLTLQRKAFLEIWGLLLTVLLSAEGGCCVE